MTVTKKQLTAAWDKYLSAKKVSKLGLEKNETQEKQDAEKQQKAEAIVRGFYEPANLKKYGLKDVFIWGDAEKEQVVSEQAYRLRQGIANKYKLGFTVANSSAANSINQLLLTINHLAGNNEPTFNRVETGNKDKIKLAFNLANDAREIKVIYSFMKKRFPAIVGIFPVDGQGDGVYSLEQTYRKMVELLNGQPITKQGLENNQAVKDYLFEQAKIAHVRLHDYVRSDIGKIITGTVNSQKLYNVANANVTMYRDMKRFYGKDRQGALKHADKVLEDLNRQKDNTGAKEVLENVVLGIKDKLSQNLQDHKDASGALYHIMEGVVEQLSPPYKAKLIEKAEFILNGEIQTKIAEIVSDATKNGKMFEKLDSKKMASVIEAVANLVGEQINEEIVAAHRKAKYTEVLDKDPQMKPRFLERQQTVAREGGLLQRVSSSKSSSSKSSSSSFRENENLRRSLRNSRSSSSYEL